MCGIAGIYDTKAGRGSLEPAIRAMTEALSHRGPDDFGYHVADTVALGHRRLSIIDLKDGHQPIYNEDATACIVYNGEVYNYREIKKELEDAGHRFTTNSDTETILHAYEQWGEECVGRLHGMFAFCVWDSKKKTLFMARDRFGKKPFFYAEYNGRFVFSSEMKSILLDTGFKRTVDDEALAAYFMFTYVPAPLTIYRGIKKLLPGHTLTYRDGQTTENKYWDIRFAPDRGKKEKDFIPEFMELLREAVRMRLLSEVPLGAFLSGGVDSSAVVALMSGVSPSPVNTFTIGFSGNTGGFDDERKYARLVAERYATNHKEYEVSPSLEGIMEKIVGSFDEPFADDSTIPSYYVYEMAGRDVRVALSGLGGDEAFCGYERYLGFHISRLYGRLPGALRDGVLRPLIERIPESSSGGNTVNHLKRFVRSSSKDNGERYLGFVSKVKGSYRDGFFTGRDSVFSDAAVSARDIFLNYFNSENAVDPLDRVFYCDIKTYLPDDILACTDRLSMHHSLEVRVPFLDHKLMEYTATIPAEIKMKWFRKKNLLKKAVSGYLPEKVINHKKQGFVGPLTQWLKTDLKTVTLERLAGKRLERHGVLNPATVKRILDDHYEGKEVNDTLIWSLLMFQTWFEMYMS